MFKTIKQEIILIGTGGIVITAVVILFVLQQSAKELEQKMLDQIEVTAKMETARVAQGIYELCKLQDDLLQIKINSDLNVAKTVMDDAGGATLSSELIGWNAVNQFTKQSHKVSLPKLQIGDQLLEPIKNPKISTPIVDKIKTMVGGTATLFQRVNNTGDMIRVATNVINQEGERAIGTYIPAINPDGTPNPVISTVLNGETFHGRAFVVNDWYSTAYAPIYDTNKNLIGMLYVRVEQDIGSFVRDAVLKTTVGKTGYVGVIGAKDPDKGRYFVSKDGERDGEVLINAKDSNGMYFVQSIVDKALALKPGEVDFEHYPWINPGDPEPRYKTGAIAYYAPWDWVIVPGAYDDDFSDSVITMSNALNEMVDTCIHYAIGIAIIFALVAFVVAYYLAAPIRKMSGIANELARGNLDISIPDKYHGEIGELANAFSEMIESQKEKAQLIDAVSVGNLNRSITVKSNNDVVGKSLQNLVSAVHRLVEDARSLSKSAVEGKLQARANTDHHQGDFRKVMEGVNATLDALTTPLNTAVDNITKISKGEIPDKIKSEYKGDFNIMKTSINTCIDSINGLVSDANLLAQSAASGNLGIRADIEKHQGDFRKIIAGVNTALDAIVIPLNEASEVLSSAAQKDVSQRMVGNYQGDLGLLKDNINAMLQAINAMFDEVVCTVRDVSAGSKQLADVSNNLSLGATRQASSFEEITSSVTEIGSQSSKNAENARKANESTKNAHVSAEKGNSEMSKMIVAMTDINESSSQIAKIIKVIDDIAFQTNLLALNAAVEAARAGRHGKGFAVVAEEVRNLASRSAKAAQSTTDLIESSGKKVEAGLEVARRANESFGEIVEIIVQVTRLVGEITVSSNDQANAVMEISKALQIVDKVTQQNTASSEETASAANELSAQANRLKMIVEEFKLQHSQSIEDRDSQFIKSRTKALPDTSA